MATFITYSKKETLKLAAEFASQFKSNGGVIALIGDLGSGKTTFVAGFAKGIGITEKILSPTFVFIRQHPIPHSQRILYHVDLYRLEDQQHIPNLGLEEILKNPDNTVFIEWAEKLGDKLPQAITVIKFNQGPGARRKIEINADSGVA